jgi:transcriptional regulator with PAS, ATPase and Fis domain
MIDIFKKIQKVAGSETTILIRGESGTGKELVARAVHYNSNRKHKDIIEINCASIPENLLESELFGHEKGSFTGAIKQKIGKFELANGASIFLDEIGDMPLSLQAKLLRVIQERKFTRVGGNQVIEVDVRVIAATNANLEEKISNGSFREDLYYRLNVIPIVIPPIRERREDIAPLINFFINKIADKHKIRKKTVKSDFYLAAERYHWPGNVRQIENAVENAVVLSDNEVISADDLPDYIRNNASLENAYSDNSLHNIEKIPINKQIDAAEKMIIERVIKECGGNKGQAAEKLGFTLRTLRNKLNKYKLD